MTNTTPSNEVINLYEDVSTGEAEIIRLELFTGEEKNWAPIR